MQHKCPKAFHTRDPAVYNTENHHHTKAAGMQDIPREDMFEFLVNEGETWGELGRLL